VRAPVDALGRVPGGVPLRQERPATGRCGELSAPAPLDGRARLRLAQRVKITV
jgi:hypothetical protein